MGNEEGSFQTENINLFIHLGQNAQPIYALQKRKSQLPSLRSPSGAFKTGKTRADRIGNEVG